MAQGTFPGSSSSSQERGPEDLAPLVDPGKLGPLQVRPRGLGPLAVWMPWVPLNQVDQLWLWLQLLGKVVLLSASQVLIRGVRWATAHYRALGVSHIRIRAGLSEPWSLGVTPFH